MKYLMMQYYAINPVESGTRIVFDPRVPTNVENKPNHVDTNLVIQALAGDPVLVMW